MVENHVIGKRNPSEDDIAENLDSLIGTGTRKLSSPEAALLLAENYCKMNFRPKEIDVEAALGAVLWREEEDPSFIVPYNDIIAEYTAYEIKKYFGYTLNEYLNLNMYEVSVIKKMAMKIRDEFLKMTDKMKKDGASSMEAGNRALSSLEELEEEIT